MAITSVLLEKNFLGDCKEEYWQTTMTGVTEGEVVTGIRWINAVIPAQKGQASGTADIEFNTYKNSATASATEDDPGSVYINNATSGNVFILRVIGK